MKGKIVKIIAAALILTLLAGCQGKNKEEYTKYSDSFFAFDTYIRIVAYTKSEDEFNYYFDKIKERFNELHKLYDRYNEYKGINNIKTINDNAGIKPVKVRKEILDLIKFSKEWYDRTGGEFNIALGPVLDIWHDYREDGKYDPANAKVPPMEKLQEAAKYTDINGVIINEEEGTVFLADRKMRIDVGGVAKGYATEIVAQEIMAEGLESGIISAGGNIRVIGKPLDNVREKWDIGIQDPDKAVITDEVNILDVVYVSDASVVTSGDYQRYYVVDGKVYHHLIDPKTLMPGDYYRAVTVVVEDSGVADVMSTAVFLLPFEESKALVESIDGLEAMWVMKDGEIRASEGMEKIMRSKGAQGKK